MILKQNNGMIQMPKLHSFLHNGFIKNKKYKTKS